METVITREGRQVMLLSQNELVDPVDAGEYIRAYCPIHGGENQRSLSVHRQSGWGRCFNASCQASGLPGERSSVLVIEWNMQAALHLTRQARNSTDLGLFPHNAPAESPAPLVRSHPRPPPDWQQEELAALYHLYRTGFLRRQIMHPWAQAYLQARHIPPEVAQSAGVGYLPAAPDLPFGPWRDQQYRGIGRWCQRLIFPLGLIWHDQVLRMGFIGRTLYGWRPGMDENEHKVLIDGYDREALAQGRQSLRRWRKTNPAGWFGYEPALFGPCLVLVEGAFDRLALLASGWSPMGVVALSGTAAQPAWFPDHVRVIVLALDADDGGALVTPRLGSRLAQAGFQVVHCLPPHDDLGKDWSERWRKGGRLGMAPLYDVCSRFVAL
jgi:Toprim-like